MRAGGTLASITLQGCPYAALSVALLVYLGGDNISTLHIYSIIAVLTTINLVVLYFFEEKKVWANQEKTIVEEENDFDEVKYKEHKIQVGPVEEEIPRNSKVGLIGTR